MTSAPPHVIMQWDAPQSEGSGDVFGVWWFFNFWWWLTSADLLYRRNKQQIGRKGARRVKWSWHSTAQFISCWACLALDQSSILKFANATQPFDLSKPTGKSYRWTHGIRMITEVCKSMGNHHDSPLLRPAKLEITQLAMRWFWRGFQQPLCSITVKLIQNCLWLDQENYIIQGSLIHHFYFLF